MPGLHHDAGRDRRVRPVYIARGWCVALSLPFRPCLSKKSRLTPRLLAVDFFSHLEMHLRQESSPLCGRDQLSYRSSYFPVKDVVDGDMCEMFTSLPHDKQRQIAEELDR